jgi:hypothetical protein
LKPSDTAHFELADASVIEKPDHLLHVCLQDKGTTAASLYAVAVADANTAWAVGSKGVIKRYNGTEWTVQRSPIAGESTLRAVAALSSRKAWAGGGESCKAVLLVSYA